MKAYRHIYLDFPDFTQESRYEVTSKVIFQNGVEDEIKTTVVCDDPYNAMEMVRDFLLSKRDWLVTEVHGQSCEGGTVLVAKTEIPSSKYAVVCDNVKRKFYKNGSYIEIEHYSVIYTTLNDSSIYLRTFDTKEKADEYCAKLNVAWEGHFGEQK